MKTTRNIIVEEAGTIPAGMQQIELVERKGTGHPTPSATPLWKRSP